MGGMKKCENCGHEHDGKYASGRFCSISCGKSFSSKINKAEKNKKISEKLKSKPTSIQPKICLSCKEEFQPKKSKRMFCSISCATKHKSSWMSKLGGLASSKVQNRRGKNEIFFSELCKEMFDNVDLNSQIFDGNDADIILHDYKLAILWNGKWHYEEFSKGQNLSKMILRDKEKIDSIRKFGYKEYIIKDLGKFNTDFCFQELEKLLKYLEENFVI